MVPAQIWDEHDAFRPSFGSARVRRQTIIDECGRQARPKSMKLYPQRICPIGVPMRRQVYQVKLKTVIRLGEARQNQWAEAFAQVRFRPIAILIQSCLNTLEVSKQIVSHVRFARSSETNLHGADLAKRKNRSQVPLKQWRLRLRKQRLNLFPHSGKHRLQIARLSIVGAGEGLIRRHFLCATASCSRHDPAERQNNDCKRIRQSPHEQNPPQELLRADDATSSHKFPFCV